MALPLISTDAQIIRVTEGLFNQRPGYTFLTDFQSFVEGSSVAALADALINYIAPESNRALAEAIATNLELEGDAADIAADYLEAQFNANPSSLGEEVLNALNLFSGLVNDATFGAAAAKFNADVLASLEYSSNPANTAVVDSDSTDSTSGYDLTVLQDNLVGNSLDNLFQARVAQNANGEQANQLATGDILDGGAGNDTLSAKVIQASPLNGGPRMAITPETTDVENAHFEALTDALGGNNPVEINAKHMLGLDEIGSVMSDSSLVVSNLTTLTDSGVYEDRRNTEEVTIRMDHTGNGDVVTPESDLFVFFDQDYLVAGETSDSQVFYFLLDQDAEDALLAGETVGEDGGVLDRLDNINVDGIVINVIREGGVSQQVTIRVDGNINTDALDSHEEFVAALQSGLAEAIEADLLPADTEIYLDDTIRAFDEFGLPKHQAELQSGNISNIIPAIVVKTTDTSVQFEAEGFSSPEKLEGEYNVFGRVSDDFATDQLPVTSTIELEKVGRGSDGGDLTVGGMSSDLSNVWDSGSGSKGVQVFNISVSGDDTQDSSLASLQSTNNTLETVNISSVEGSEADLKIGNSATNAVLVNGIADNDDDMTTAMNSALKDVRTFNAVNFVNDASVYAYVSDESVAKYMDLTDSAADPAADNADFEYNFGAGHDMLNINISKTNLAQSGSTNREDFSMSIDGGAGNDTIKTQIGDGTGVAADHWYINSELNDNLVITAGSGNDVVHTWGAGSWNVNLGEGHDVIYSDNSGNQLNVANDVTLDSEDAADLNYNSGRAVWVLNSADQVTAGAAERHIDNLQSDANDNHAFYNAVVEVNLRGIIATAVVDEYNTTDLELNNIIKGIIEADEFLSDLIVAEDGPANTLVIRSLTDGVFDAADLAVTVAADNDFSLSSSQIAEFAAANGDVTIDTMEEVRALINDDIADWTAATDYDTAMAHDGATDLLGANSTAVTASTIVDGTGNDTIVLSTSGLDTEVVNLTNDDQRDVIYNATNAIINGLGRGDIVIGSNGEVLFERAIDSEDTSIVDDFIVNIDNGGNNGGGGNGVVRTPVNVEDLQTYDATADDFEFILDYATAGAKFANINGFDQGDAVRVVNAPAGSDFLFDSSDATSIDLAYGDVVAFSNAWVVSMGDLAEQLVTDVVAAADVPAQQAVLDTAWGDWFLV